MIAYRDYPTVVNEIPESGVYYSNKPEEYAKMDSLLQSCQKAIGGSSDSAQLAQSYMWDKVARGEFDDEYKELYNNVVILAVLAQCAIDSTKREFAVDVNEEIRRIRSMPCMKREKDYPKFMKWTHKLAVTKNGKERPYDDIKKEKKKVEDRIDDSIVCPMNWLQECLDKIQGAPRTNVVENADFVVCNPGNVNRRQIGRIRKIVEEFDAWTRINITSHEFLYDDTVWDRFINKTEEVMGEIRSMKLSDYTINRLIVTAFGITREDGKDRKIKEALKYTRKMLNVLYMYNKEKFLKNFKHQ